MCKVLGEEPRVINEWMVNIYLQIFSDSFFDLVRENFEVVLSESGHLQPKPQYGQVWMVNVWECCQTFAHCVNYMLFSISFRKIDK